MNVNPQIHELSEAMRTTKSRRLYERYQAVKLVLEGFQLKEEELLDIIAFKTLEEVGFPARANWTLSLALQLITRKWGFTYSLKGTVNILHRPVHALLIL